MTRPTIAQIDLDALSYNFQTVKSYAKNSSIMAVVKADGYGHGVAPISKALIETDAFAVAFLDEAIELREAGIIKPIVLLEGLFDAAELPIVCKYQLEIVVHQAQQVMMLESYQGKSTFTVWLKLDTGMHRIGVAATEFISLYQRLTRLDSVIDLRLMSHFSCADQTLPKTTNKQIDTFNKVTADIKLPVSLANSAALIAYPQTRRDWVRPGLILYGASPFSTPAQHAPTLKPVMTMKSSLIAIRDVKQGETVGYGGNWIAKRTTSIGTIAIGYADGYPRALPSGTPVLIRGKTVELAGRVSMDMISVDLTNCPEAKLGDEVILWGKGLPVEDIAAYAGTIAYEILTGVSQRVPRIYI